MYPQRHLNPVSPIFFLQEKQRFLFFCGGLLGVPAASAIAASRAGLVSGTSSDTMGTGASLAAGCSSCCWT